MSNFRGHALGSVFAYVFFVILVAQWFILCPEELLICFVICFLFALWPDVDTNSKGQDIFYSAFLIVDIAFIWFEEYRYASILGLFAILPIVGKHRGWTHSFLAAICIPFAFLFVVNYFWPGIGKPYYYFSALAGYLSHLILDRKFKII